MSDFSVFRLFTAGLACMVPFASAYTTPVGAKPQGNPISQPGLNSIVPAGKPFTITWEPTTQGTVTLVLLKGPSENAVPQYAIVEKTENDGEYVWTPSTDLAPTANAQGYGIQLIDDATGQYQYTTQFGISNAGHDEDDAPVTPQGYATPQGYGDNSHSSSSSSSSKASSAYPTATGAYYPHHPIATSAYYPANNVTKVMPTAGKPTTIQTSIGKTRPAGPSATPSVPAPATGVASSLAISVAGLLAAAGVAMFAA